MSAAPDSSTGILWLPDALEHHCNRNVVMGVRESGPTGVYTGKLQRQVELLLMELRSAGTRRVAIAGNGCAYQGKLSTGRPDLRNGVAHARRFNAILCYRDITRLFRPAAYDYLTNPYAPYTPEDYAELRTFVGPDVPLAVALPPDLTPKELHLQKTLDGNRQAAAEGRLQGRPRIIQSEKDMQDIVTDYQDGVSCSAIADRYCLGPRTVQRFIAELEKSMRCPLR